MAEEEDLNFSILTPSFQTGRIKKIMKLDKDISKINSEALFLVTLSTDLFLDFLAERSAKVSIEQKRKTVKVEQIRAAVKMHQPSADFLLESMKEPVKEVKEKVVKEVKEKEVPKGTQRIDRFFNKERI